mmetsp:Transcript_80806/g.161135  ORF Transcript_80806/g.161135 Transcript_80806/m.161135 type:complete len:140 (+) Transcript_80806:204-623(+)
MAASVYGRRRAQGECGKVAAAAEAAVVLELCGDGGSGDGKGCSGWSGKLASAGASCFVEKGAPGLLSGFPKKNRKKSCVSRFRQLLRSRSRRKTEKHAFHVSDNYFEVETNLLELQAEVKNTATRMSNRRATRIIYLGR